MKKLTLIITLAFVSPAFQGCQTSPSQRTQTYTTLRVLGASIETSMTIAARMFKAGEITQAQWDRLADIHDNKIQPAYRLAVQSAKANLSSVASPELVTLVTDFSNLILSLQK